MFASSQAEISRRGRNSQAAPVASEHLYNLTNIGLNIHSDMLCDITRKNKKRQTQP